MRRGVMHVPSGLSCYILWGRCAGSGHWYVLTGSRGCARQGRPSTFALSSRFAWEPLRPSLRLGNP
eukprot:185242-Alexandrium_andersonii.AAC.1